MDQNDLDVEQGDCSWRQVYQVEEGSYPTVKASCISLACMHCEDAPCIMGCPTGAIAKKESGMVFANPALCIGCHSCLVACPFGVPRYNEYGKMRKCTMCWERVEEGLEPACVRVCPTRALKFGPVNELGKELEGKSAAKLVHAAGHLAESR